MTLSLNKEQVLALVVFGLCAWIYSGFGDVAGPGRPFAPTPLEHEVVPFAKAPLVDADAPPSGRSDLFTQPRETRSLPPRELAFPPRSPATVAALPLEIGPDYRHLVLLATDGSPVSGVTIEVGSPGDAGSSPSPETGEQAPLDRAALFEQGKKTYDQVLLEGQREVFLGLVEVRDAEGKLVDPFDAEEMKDFSNHVVKLRIYDVTKNRFTSTQVYKPGELVRVVDIRLADNLRNQVEREKRRVSSGNLVARAKLVDWLLEKARVDSWVFDEAMAQANLYAQEAGNNLDGLRLQLRVLRARGDLAGELALLDGLVVNRESAVRYWGLGRVCARLGLWQDAEDHLRRAVALAAQDARAHAALAEYLLGRGRSREAVASARHAERAFNGLVDVEEKVRTGRVIIASYLAVGDLEGAGRARGLLSGDLAQPYLDGCIAYAAGDAPGALSAFRIATGSPRITAADRGEARLGEAASLLQLGEWQSAAAALLEVYDERPLLRHRAAAGLALLYQRLEDLESSLTWADRALEADPRFAYAYYLRGRALRLADQYAGADEAFAEALRLHDDFVHAIVERATLFAARGEAIFGDEQARLTRDAMRYADRAASLSPAELAELYVLQGLRHYYAADRSGAAAAFTKAAEAATTDTDKLFARGALAVVDYSRDRVDDARAVLLRMVEDLGKEDPVRVWADATVQAIDEHAQKEMLEDRFERTEPGNIWPDQRDGRLRAAIADGRLVFRGEFEREPEVSAERQAAVQKAKNFLAVAVTMQLGARHARMGFAGLRIMTQQGAGGRTDSRIEVGVRDGAPYLRLIDNREETRPEIDVPGFDLSGPQELELRVLPRGEDQGRQFVLQVSWNGQVVFVQELKSISGAVQTELKTILFAQGVRGSAVDVAFDDYRLERRKER